IWQLKPNLISALEKSTLVDNIKSEGESKKVNSEVFIEGNVLTRISNQYERNPKARKKCIQYYGTKCFICSFDFELAYGEIGKGFIEVHHLVPVSEIKAEYEIDAIEDLRPVCSNCHSMIHRT